MRKSRIFIVISVVLLAIGTLIATKVEFSYHKDHEGIYVFKGHDGTWLELSDDLFPEESHRLLWSNTLKLFKNVETSGACAPSTKPCISYEWNKNTGRGFIKATHPDGRKLIFNLGRYQDSYGNNVSGLFMGGGLPPGDPDFKIFDKNETGMAYFDGSRYYHIWCNANEGIVDAADKPIYPSQWQFVSSKVLENSANDLTIVSKHHVLINNVPVIVDRFMFYQLGNNFVTLVISFRNVGSTPTVFSYIYGDEPWLGNYGTSAGNVGWLKDRLVLTESAIDTKRYNYAGMFDYGNPLAGETHDSFSRKANFIEWQPESRPDTGYFSNQFGSYASEKEKTPLASPNNRVIALQWGPNALNPGQTYSFTIAVGMADNDPVTGLPVKPDTHLY